LHCMLEVSKSVVRQRHYRVDGMGNDHVIMPNVFGSGSLVAMQPSSFLRPRVLLSTRAECQVHAMVIQSQPTLTRSTSAQYWVYDMLPSSPNSATC